MTRLRRPRAGFTLVELLIVITLLSIVMLATSKVILVVQKDYVAQRGSSAAEDRLQTAEETILRVMRGARSNPYSMGTSPSTAAVPTIFPDPLGNGSWNNIRVQGDFNPADGDVADELEDVTLFTRSDTLFVRWTSGGADQPVAFPVRSVTFRYFGLDNTEDVAAPIDVSVRRVRYQIVVPRTANSATLVQRIGWVFLRN